MEGFRAVFDPQPGPLSVTVLGFHHDIGEVTGTTRGTHDWFCFVFHDAVPALAGTGWVTTAVGGMMIHGPGEPIRHGIDGSWLRSWLRFTGEGIETLLAGCGLRTRTHYAVDDPALHDRWVRAIHRELTHPRGHDPRSVRDLVACWWRDAARSAMASAAVPPAAVAARELIERRYREDLSLDGVAAATGLSRTHLCRAFKAAWGTTPMRYVRRLRLEHAAELLRGGDLPVGEVARRSGFADVYYFSRAFRAAWSCPPTAWRRG